MEKATADQLRSVLDGLSEAVCRFLPDGTLTYVNQAYCEMFGMSREELLAGDNAPGVYPQDLERLREEMREVTPEDPLRLFENRTVRASGEIIWTQWINRGLFDSSGKLVGYQAEGRDITDRVRAEQHLKRQHQRSRFLAEASRILAGSLDYETTLTQVVQLAVPFLADGCSVSLFSERGGTWERLAVFNVDPAVEAAARETLMRSNEALQGFKQIYQLLLEGESVLMPVVTEAELETMGLNENMLAWVRRMRPLSYMVVPMIAHDSVVGAMSFTTSRTRSGRTFDQEDLELAQEIARRGAQAIENAQLVRALREQDESKNRFLATLGHELRNPLAAIQHALDVLDIAKPGERPYIRALEVARRQVRHQTRLVDDLLDVARLTRGTITLQRTTVNASEQVRDVMEAHRASARSKEQELTLDAPEAAWVLADAARLQQIVGNLVDNAIKYCPRGAIIRAVVRRQNGAVRICVIDNGPGISAELHAHIFEPFVQGEPTHQTPSTGIGMGMTIVHHLVELHGGAVELKEGPAGRGTNVTITMPSAPQAQPGTEPDAPTPQTSHLNVLVVDDNADAADMLASLIETWGHKVRAVYGGREALEAIERDRPNLVLMDIGMPDLDGYDTARIIRRDMSEVPVHLIALSGYARASDVATALEAGFDRHLAKPVDGPTIRQVLEEELLETGAV